VKAAIALIGDHDERVTAHRAIRPALELARDAAGADVGWTWIRTDDVDAECDPPRLRSRPGASLADWNAVWVVPASPYASMAGALAAIRFARETSRPFLGTCGGFQHALVESARNVCRVPGADHAETNPGAADPVVTRLACGLVEASGAIAFLPGSRLEGIYGGQPATEGYRCSYGLNPAWRGRLEAAGWRFTGLDPDGGVRAGELSGHPFYIGTLFQPERSALRGERHPLIAAFVAAAAR